MTAFSGEPALILQRKEYAESDLVVTMFGRSQGRFSALARGARKSRKRFGGGLDLFTVSEVSASRIGTRLWTLQAAVPRLRYDELAGDPVALGHGSYAVELLRELSAAEVPSPALFDLSVALLESLRAAGPRAGRIRVYERLVLAALGLEPVLCECSSCGGILESGVHFDVSRGGLLCATCSAGSTEHGVRSVSADAVKVLRLLGEARDLEDGDLLDGPARHEVRTLMLSCVLHHVGRPLRSLEYIAKLSNSR